MSDPSYTFTLLLSHLPVLYIILLIAISLSVILLWISPCFSVSLLMSLLKILEYWRCAVAIDRGGTKLFSSHQVDRSAYYIPSKWQMVLKIPKWHQWHQWKYSANSTSDVHCLHALIRGFKSHQRFKSLSRLYCTLLWQVIVLSFLSWWAGLHHFICIYFPVIRS